MQAMINSAGEERMERLLRTTILTISIRKGGEGDSIPGRRGRLETEVPLLVGGGKSGAVIVPE